MAAFINANVFYDAIDGNGEKIRVTGFQLFLVVCGCWLFIGFSFACRREIRKFLADHGWCEYAALTPLNSPTNSPTVGPLKDAVDNHVTGATYKFTTTTDSVKPGFYSFSTTGNYSGVSAYDPRATSFTHLALTTD